MEYRTKKKCKNSIALKSVSLALVLTIILSNYMPIISKRYDSENFPTSTLTDTFPESYMPYINKLKSEHPTWVFKAVNTGLDWNEVVNHETYISGGMGVSTVLDSMPSEWKKDGENNYMDGPYVTASKKAVEYVIDPRNSLNNEGIFQFESLSYSKSAHTLAAVDGILSNTPMGHVDYKMKYQSKTVGNWVEMGKSYAQIILEKSEKYGISPIHVASRIKQENSGDIINGKLINGVYPEYEGYYNFFNIGATPGADGNSSVLNGMITAKNNGWDNPEKAIDAGANKLKNGYIKYGQDTIYFQKFDVNNPYGNATVLYGSQYMTNIMAPKNEALISYNSYNKQNLLGVSFEFHIPVYLNMPTSAAPYPTDSSNGYFEDDNTWIYLDDTSDYGVEDVFNIRSAPDDSTSTNVIAVIRENKEGAENRTKFLRIGKGVGLQWDKIKLSDGREGYIFTGSGFVHEYDYTKVSSVTLNEESVKMSPGETKKLEAKVLPDNAFIKDVTWSSTDKNIVKVQEDGTIEAMGIGTATVTVTTKDQSKTASCLITVANKNVESITLENNEYKILKDSYVIIEPTVLPSTAENKKYNVTIEDKNIVEFIDGKFVGKNIGTTKITFTTEDGNKSVSATITVLEEDITIDESIKINGSTLSGISPETKVSSIKEKITTTYNIEIKNTSGNILTDEDLVGTDTKVNIKNSQGDIICAYTIVIYGDVNGDGIADSMDMYNTIQHILENRMLEGIFLKAGDTNSDLKIDSMDMYNIIQIILKK